MDQHVGIVTLKVEILQCTSKPFARARTTSSPASMVLVALNTGMRKSEQPNLQWSEVDFSSNLAYPDESGRHRSLAKPSSDAP